MPSQGLSIQVRVETHDLWFLIHNTWSPIVRGPKKMSIIVQHDATIYSFIIFLHTALHVSDDTLIHHQEHVQTVITTSGTGRTVFATVRRRGGVGT